RVASVPGFTAPGGGDCNCRGGGNTVIIRAFVEGHEGQPACAQLNRSLPPRRRQNALTATEPQQAGERVETTCRPTGTCLRLLSHPRNRPPRCSTRREPVMRCFEIPRGPQMSSQRSQERSTRSGQRGETAAWLGGSLSHCWTLSRALANAPPHRESAVHPSELAEPAVAKAGVGVVHFVFAPRGSVVSGRQ